MCRSAFLLLISLLLTLCVGSLAHAMESSAPHGEATAAWHWDGDDDHFPPDQDSAVPHHHGSCHGHHIGTPVARISVAANHVLSLAGESEPAVPMQPVERQPEIDPPIS